ncbi:MAG: type II secretion system F family protein [Anaerolineales bacterium]
MSTQIAIGLIILLFTILFAMGMRRLVLSGDVIHERLQIYANVPQVARPRGTSRSRSWVRRLRISLNAAFSGFAPESLRLNLVSANWPITSIEYVVTRLTFTALGFLLGSLFSNSIPVGIGVALLTYIIPGIILNRSVHRRRLKFSNQLVDVLVLITGSVRAGFSLLQSLEVVGREIKPPASEEFNRVLYEISYGRSAADALSDLALRMDNVDLDLLVTAINIQNQVGGNLTTMLNSVTETIRERIRLFGEVRVLTTQQRMTSYVLSLLPFFVFGILLIISPEYMMRLFDRRIICIPIVALVGIVLGFFIVRRMARIDI